MSRMVFFVKCWCTVLAWGFVSALPVAGQPFGGGFGGTGALLQSQEVQQEIELVDEQQAELRQIGEEVRDQMRSLFAGMRDLDPEERRERFESLREDMADITSQVETRIQDVLLPHQYERLKEINLQQQIRQQGMAGALSGGLAEELGISEEQREKLTTRAQELQAEMQEKIVQLRQEAENELLQILTPDQRSKLESLRGKGFQMPEPQFGFGRDRGGRGFRGPRTSE